MCTKSVNQIEQATESTPAREREEEIDRTKEGVSERPFRSSCRALVRYANFRLAFLISACAGE